MLFQGLSWLRGQWLIWPGRPPKAGCRCQDCVHYGAGDAGGRQAGGRGWAGGRAWAGGLPVEPLLCVRVCWSHCAITPILPLYVD